jgi:hypothetical protein
MRLVFNHSMDAKSVLQAGKLQSYSFLLNLFLY